MKAKVVLAISVLSLIALSGYTRKLRNHSIVKNQQEPSDYLIGIKRFYEAEGPTAPIPTKLGFVIHGRLFESFRNGFKLAAVTFQEDGRVIYDIDRLQKSRLYTITNDWITIVIPLDSNYRRHFTPLCCPSYMLLAVPDGISMEDFDTVRQAKALGVQVLEGVSSANVPRITYP
jgi:hypothetical protein